LLARSSGLAEGSDVYIGRLHSPDDSKIAIWQRGDTALRIYDTESGDEIRVLPTGKLDDVSGSWSPDGKQFAFTRYHNSDSWHSYDNSYDSEWYSEMYIIKADGTGLRRLGQHYAHSSLGRPHWSPDGRQMAVAGTFSYPYSHHLFLFTLATDEVRTFNNIDIQGGDEDYIMWSPDEKWVAFVTDPRDVRALNLETGEVFCITQNRSIIEEEEEEVIDWH
jgi:Tol biopolymer transport system component